MTASIRPEAPGDVAAIREVVTAAFGGSDEVDLIDALRAFFSPPPGLQPDYGEPLGTVLFLGEERGLTYEQLWNTGQPVPGEVTNLETALRIIAVQSAMRLLANDISSLPTDAFRTSRGRVRCWGESWLSRCYSASRASM